MIDDTILVVDADHETEEKILSTLEAEGYLVFTASGRDVSTGMAEKISPALIYLKPTANSVEGFEVCKAIHGMEKYRNVPIVLLTSLKGPLDPRYTTFYGVVDYLKMPLSHGELIEMTEKILGSRSRNVGESEEHTSGAEEVETAAEEEMPLTDEPSAFDREFADITEVDRPNEDYSYSDSQEDVSTGVFKRGRRTRPKQSSLLSPLVIAVAIVAILAAGALSYWFFVYKPAVEAPVAVKPPSAVEQQMPPVLPPAEQQRQEQPVAETKSAEVKEMPKEAPAKKPAAAQAPLTATKPVTKKVYSVQLGAFKSEDGANGLVKDFIGKGYEAFTQKGTTTNNTSVYRVLIGTFENRKEALRLAAQIETKEKIKTTIYNQSTK